MMRVSDLRSLGDLAHAHGALLSVDNSVMSPMLSTPLALGADIVIHSATKYFAGHSDVMAGVVAVSDPEIASRIAFVQNAEGSGLAPFVRASVFLRRVLAVSVAVFGLSWLLLFLYRVFWSVLALQPI